MSTPGASWLVAAPILVPLGTSVVALLVRRSPALQRAATLAGSGLLLACGAALLGEVAARGPLVTHVGDWRAPFGIVLVADMLSALMVAVTGVVALAVAVYARRQPSPGGWRGQVFVPLLLAGVGGAFVTGDLFNLYVWFEVLLIASFALLGLGRGGRPPRAAASYVLLNLVSSALLLAALGLLHGLAGSLSLADLATKLPALDAPLPLAVVAGLLLTAFGIKAGIFPLFFWLPDAYPKAPTAIAALFAGLLTKVGVYALLRVFPLLFAGQPGVQPLLVALALATMVAGVLGAISRGDIREILSFHIISQIGYMVLGVGLGSQAALAATIFYVIHHILVKTNLFLVGGLIEHAGGASALDRLGGLYRDKPGLTWLFAVPAMSLAGLPPLSGFWAKLLLIKATFAASAYVSAGVSLAVSALTLLSMTKIWRAAFWRPAPSPRSSAAASSRPGDVAWAPSPLPSAGLALVTILIGLAPGLLLEAATVAAGGLLDPAAYVAAVFGGGR